MKCGHLFNGIGGFALAAHKMGWQNTWHCEIDDFCNKVMNYHFPESKQYLDIKNETNQFEPVDLVTGGFPCQGFSVAGGQAGTDDDRYLWPEMLNVVKRVKPSWVVGENVTGILSMEDKSGVWKEIFAKVESRKIVRYDTIDLFDAVYTRQAKMLIASICEDLEKQGYEVQPLVIPAASVGAPHRRDRVWIIAHADNAGSGEPMRTDGSGQKEDRRRERQPQPKYRENGGYGDAANPGGPRRQQQHLPEKPTGKGYHTGIYDQEQANGWSQFPTVSPVCQRDDGISLGLAGITFSKWRREGIKALGNAIVPAVALQIFKAIQAYEA